MWTEKYFRGSVNFRYVRSVWPGPGEDWQSRAYFILRISQHIPKLSCLDQPGKKNLTCGSVNSETQRVLEHRPKMKEVVRNFPMIGLKAWAEYLLREAPEFVLGGNSLDTDYQKTYCTFWETYSKLDGGHPVFADFPRSSWGNLVPYCLHGDEGRGKAKRPVLVTSYQMLIPKGGLETTNMHR